MRGTASANTHFVNTTNTNTETTVRCRAFSGQGVRAHRCLISGRVVRVYDPVAGHYTRCHRLSAATQARIARKEAR